MNQKKRDVLFSILLVVISGFVFFALGVTAAWKWGFPKGSIVVEYPVYDTGASTTASTTVFVGKIDLNKATAAELMQIEGIGEKTAQNIIEYREKIGKYTFLEQLLDVDGVGEKKLNAWKDFLTLDEVETTSAMVTTIATTTTTTATTTTTQVVTSTTIFDGVLNLNTATKEELMLISGIGEVTATKIIEYRDSIGGFTSLEQLMDIDGIGEKKFAAWSHYFTLED